MPKVYIVGGWFLEGHQLLLGEGDQFSFGRSVHSGCCCRKNDLIFFCMQWYPRQRRLANVKEPVPEVLQVLVSASPECICPRYLISQSSVINVWHVFCFTASPYGHDSAQNREKSCTIRRNPAVQSAYGSNYSCLHFWMPKTNNLTEVRDLLNEYLTFFSFKEACTSYSPQNLSFVENLFTWRLGKYSFVF